MNFINNMKIIIMVIAVLLKYIIIYIPVFLFNKVYILNSIQVSTINIIYGDGNAFFLFFKKWENDLIIDLYIFSAFAHHDKNFS